MRSVFVSIFTVVLVMCRAHHLTVVVPVRGVYLDMLGEIYCTFMSAYLQRHLREDGFEILLVEQLGADDEAFNRAMLFNVGILANWNTSDYFATMDVDLVPYASNAESFAFPANNTPIRLSHSICQYEKRWQCYEEYERNAGGGMLLTREVLRQTNGYSNQFWGWGGEDDEFYCRLEQNGYRVRGDVARNRMYHMSGVIDNVTWAEKLASRNPVNIILMESLCKRRRRFELDGLRQIPPIQPEWRSPLAGCRRIGVHLPRVALRRSASAVQLSEKLRLLHDVLESSPLAQRYWVIDIEWLRNWHAKSDTWMRKHAPVALAVHYGFIHLLRQSLPLLFAVGFEPVKWWWRGNVQSPSKVSLSNEGDLFDFFILSTTEGGRLQWISIGRPAENGSPVVVWNEVEHYELAPAVFQGRSWLRPSFPVQYIRSVVDDAMPRPSRGWRSALRVRKLNPTGQVPQRWLQLFQTVRANGLQWTRDHLCVQETDHHDSRFFDLNSNCLTQLEARDVLVATILTFAELLTRNRLEWWMSEGTLLGAVRHQRLIAWERDGDFAMQLTEIERLRHIDLRSQIKGPYVLEISGESAYYQQGPSSRPRAIPARFINTRFGLYVDVFGFTRTGTSLASIVGDTWRLCVSCVQLNASDESSYQLVAPVKWFFPLATCVFANVTLPCPRDAHAYLSVVYGADYMVEKHTAWMPPRKMSFADNLRAWHDVLERNGSALAGRLWVIGGVLLGWAREGALLAHDADADFGVWDEDRTRLYSTLPALTSAGFKPLYCWTNNDGKIVEISFEKDGSKFELFIHHHDNGRIGSYVFGRLQANGSLFELQQRYERYTLSAFSFLNRSWLKPDDHERYLECEYGARWLTSQRNWSYVADSLSIVSRKPYSGSYDWRACESVTW
jgi:hypothetical protein